MAKSEEANDHTVNPCQLHTNSRKSLNTLLRKRKIGSITETDIQSYISYLYESGRLDKSGGLTVKTIRDVILVLRLAMEYAYKERAIPLLNWDLIEYPKELGVKKVVSLSKDQEQALIQCIYMDLNRKTAGILIALFTGVRIGELCGLQMKDISLTDKTISINKTVQRIYDKKKGESYLHIGPPKTKTSARTIPVPSLLMNIIKKFYTENPNHYFLTGKTKPTEPRTYRQFFSRFLKRNGLQKVKFHEMDTRYNTLYQMYLELRKDTFQVEFDSEFSYTWKRSSYLYEMWCFFRICHLLSGKYEPGC